MAQFTFNDMQTLESVLSELSDMRAALRMIGMDGFEQKLLNMEHRVRSVAKANCPDYPFDATTQAFGVIA